MSLEVSIWCCAILKWFSICLIAYKALIGRSLLLTLCYTLSNQQLLENYLNNHLLNANALQMFFSQCSHMELLEKHL